MAMGRNVIFYVAKGAKPQIAGIRIREKTVS
jgi:hypothetical protein